MRLSTITVKWKTITCIMHCLEACKESGGSWVKVMGYLQKNSLSGP